MNSMTPDRNPWRLLGELAPTVAPRMAAMFQFCGNQYMYMLLLTTCQSYEHRLQLQYTIEFD